MPLPFDVQSTLEQNRKTNRRQRKQAATELSAVLANEAGVWPVPGKNGNEMYVRLLGNQEDENSTYLPSTTAFVRGDFFEYNGSPILVKYNKDGNLVIIGPDETQVAQAGNYLSLSSLNSGSKQNKWLNLDNVLRLISRPVSRGDTDSLLVSVAQFIYDHYGNYIEFNGTPLQADKIDVSSYVPASGLHRQVQLWLDTYNNTVEITTSTAKSIATAIGTADYDETWLGSTRFQDWLPLQSYTLQDAQTTVTQKHLGRDHRQQFHLPDELGNESTLTVNTRIRADRQYLIKNELIIPAGFEMVINTGAEVIIDKHHAPNIMPLRRITTTPDTLTTIDTTLFVNTDTTTVVINLPAGIEELTYRIVNTGTSGYFVDITPNGVENLLGENSAFRLKDSGESLIISYNVIDGWY